MIETLASQSSFKTWDILRRNRSANRFYILVFTLHKAMISRKMFNEIIAVDSLVNRTVPRCKSQTSHRRKSSRVETDPTFTAPGSLIFIIFPCDTGWTIWLCQITKQFVVFLRARETYLSVPSKMWFVHKLWLVFIQLDCNSHEYTFVWYWKSHFREEHCSKSLYSQQARTISLSRKFHRVY